MKVFLKTLLYTVVTLLTIVIIVISIALWLVFTPEKMTKIVRDQAKKQLSCTTEIGEVELTFFSTFPQFGIKIEEFKLINPCAGAPSDTLINLEQLTAKFDVVKFWKHNHLTINELSIINGKAAIYSDSNGNTNYSIFQTPSDTTSQNSKDTTNNTLPVIQIEEIDLQNFNLLYIDHALEIIADIKGLDARLSGLIVNDTIDAQLRIDKSVMSVQYSDEKYLDNTTIQLEIKTQITQWGNLIVLDKVVSTINDIALIMNGAVSYNSNNGDISVDIDYQIDDSQIVNVMEIIPPSFRHYYEGLEATGIVSSQGKITGQFTDSIFPLFDLNFSINKGSIAYEGLPLTLHDVEAEIGFISDLSNDDTTLLKIKWFEAKTPHSTLHTKGYINQLFSEMFINLNTGFNLNLNEFNAMIPTEYNMKLNGNANGNIKSSFTYDQLFNFELDKMKLAGEIKLSDFTANYDTIQLSTGYSEVQFALPNTHTANSATNFASINLKTKNLKTSTPLSINLDLRNALIIAETSNFMNTDKIPDVIASFKIDSLYVRMDSIQLAAAQPIGKIKLSTKAPNHDEPIVYLNFNSNYINAKAGSNTASIEHINLETDLINDKSQDDLFLQWLVKGFIEIDKGNIAIDGFKFPIEIPTMKMDFEPELLKIKEGTIIIDQSDFTLTGNINNMLSYYRGDSILRGQLSFSSNVADINQLMNLTSGMGYDQENKPVDTNTPTTAADTVFQGPYMVPKGIDITMNTNVKYATFGADTAINIEGDVRIYDGILLLDEVKLATHAARMQLTAMYRTPRKNHLFLGIDYHMLDVEISELLRMIPDIDSLMPMLRSFGGEGEFHMAIETYLDSSYNIKKSTLRGAASITGQDLVLMDGETFGEIAKTLRFNKKTQNRIDSLSAEFTIFREEIDIYPFLIVMDKYKAVVGGRHNFDLSFDYHISLVDSPIPIKLGIDIKGNMDDMKFRPAKCRYAEFYRPVSRRVVQNKQLELRRLIRESLTQRVTE